MAIEKTNSEVKSNKEESFFDPSEQFQKKETNVEPIQEVVPKSNPAPQPNAIDYESGAEPDYKKQNELLLERLERLESNTREQMAMFSHIANGQNTTNGAAKAIAIAQQVYDPADELKEPAVYYAYQFRKSIDCYSIGGRLVPNPLGRMVHFEPFATYQEGKKDGNRIPICRVIITSKKESKWLEASAGIEYGVSFFKDTNNIISVDFEEELIRQEAATRMSALTASQIIAEAKNQIESGNKAIVMSKDIGQMRLQLIPVFMKQVKQEQKQNAGKMHYSLESAIAKAEKERAA